MSGGFAHRDRLHGATVLMGHSRGGSGLCESSGLTAEGPGPNQIASNETYQVLVYRPDAGMSAWPEDPLPLVVFIPGADQYRSG